VTDITYLPTAAGWVYLAVVLDLFSRKVVGWAISESLATQLASTALRNAVELRKPDTNGLLHHSDRGSQYTSDQYQQTLRTLNMTCSMSRTGCCYDNAVMERFFLVTQARVDEVRIFRRHHSGKAQRVSVHRNILQLYENSSDARIPNTRRIRRTTSSQTRRLKTNSGVHPKWAIAT
jgi:putative transposase